MRKSYPSENLMDSFSTIVSELKLKVSGNTKNNKSLAKTRDTLLPKLLSGELRIPDAEKLVEEATANTVGA